MTKTTKIALLTTLFAVVVLIVGTAYVASGKEAVTVTEEVLAGDVSRVEGMELQLETTMGDRHFWEMAVPLGHTEDIQVSYEYFTRVQQRAVEEPSIDLEIARQGWVSFFDATTKEDMGWGCLAKASADIMSRTEVGETRTETVLYSDYYDYYPLNVMEQLVPTDPSNVYGYLRGDAYHKFEEAIQLPVVEGDAVELTISRDELGGTSVEGNMIPDIEEVTTDTLSVVEEDCFYISVQLHQGKPYQGQPLMDREVYYGTLIPDDGMGIDIGEITKIATIPQSIQMIDLADGGEVLLGLIIEDEHTYLATYSKSDFTELDRLLLPQGGSRLELMEGAVYIPSEDVFTVVTIDGMNCEIVLEGTFEDVIRDSEWTVYNSGGTFNYLDGKLFLVYPLEYAYGVVPDVIVHCYDTEGLVYAGRYACSQKQDTMDEKNGQWMGYSRRALVQGGRKNQ